MEFEQLGRKALLIGFGLRLLIVSGLRGDIGAVRFAAGRPPVEILLDRQRPGRRFSSDSEASTLQISTAGLQPALLASELFCMPCSADAIPAKSMLRGVNFLSASKQGWLQPGLVGIAGQGSKLFRSEGFASL